MHFVLFVAIGVFVVIAIISSCVWAKARREELQKFATEAGLTYNRKDPFNIEERFGFFQLFNIGHSKRAENVMSGVYRGHEYVACDYRYTTGSGKNQSTHRQAVCICRIGYNFPKFLLRPEGILDKAAGLFGLEDIEFDSDEFSRKFFVKCTDEKFARDLCNPRMMEWLLENGGAHMEIYSRCLLVQHGRTWSAARLLSAFDHIEAFLEQIPESLIKEYDG